MRRSSVSRSCLDVSEYVANAFRAAATALSTSSAFPAATVWQTSSVAGLMTAIVLFPEGAIHFRQCKISADPFCVSRCVFQPYWRDGTNSFAFLRRRLPFGDLMP
jgi:hypothetical protein